MLGPAPEATPIATAAAPAPASTIGLAKVNATIASGAR
jgi:hypothetical protein